jgi:hypothetical protein
MKGFSSIQALINAAQLRIHRRDNHHHAGIRVTLHLSASAHHHKASRDWF